MNTPYVVSADVRLLLIDWADRQGFLLPPPIFFETWRQDFIVLMSSIFPDFQFIREDDLCCGLGDLADQTPWPIISIDKVYLDSAYYLESSRLVDCTGEDVGVGSRGDSQPLIEQIEALKGRVGDSVALLDDVIFSGDSLEKIIHSLAAEGITVKAVIGGIVTRKGLERIAKICPVSAVFLYDDVVDEVCERDFFPGIPLSGRSVDAHGDFGIPYIKPFGRPDSWASLPADKQDCFSIFCLDQTIKLFLEIEKYSSKKVLCSNIERKTIDLPKDGSSYVDYLWRVLTSTAPNVRINSQDFLWEHNI